MMDTCLNNQDLLTEYAAGDLDGLARARVDTHLARCSACRAELARELDLRHTLGDLPAVTCPDRVTAAILAAVDAEDAVRPVRRPRPRWQVAAPLAAAVLALAILLPRALDHSQGLDATYSAAEIHAARRDATTVLLLAAQAIDQGERATARRLGESFPESLTRTLKTITELGEGGQG